MNKNIARPLIIQLTPPETDPVMRMSQKSLFVPVNTKWVNFKDNVMPLMASSKYDSVLVHVMDNVNRDMKGVVGSIAVKVNTLSGAGTKTGKPVLAYDSPDKPFYLMNPTRDDMREAGLYAPSDDTIMEKYKSYGSDGAWQEHQDKIWGRMKDMMPLSKRTDKFNRDHAAQLKDPKRGMEDKDLEKFWSFKRGASLAPTIMGDDMVGMPSVEGREYAGFTMSNRQPDGSVSTKPVIVRSLITTGAAGIMIPMANADGHVSKHQVATDMTVWGTVLHFRAEDGITVEKKALLDKMTKEYNFKFTDGEPTHLKVTDVSVDSTITMQDAHGLFNVKPKKEIVDILRGRGYEIPPIITSIKAEQNGKYVWQAPGTMTGSEGVLKTVSPSNPGYIVARPPKNGASDYVALVTEGALKGHIVAKYVDVKDRNGICFGDKIAGDKGIIVTQVPGVSEAYIKNALTIYDKYDIKGTYIAMDADGRENRNVALGIRNAYDYVNKVNPATVLSWDPAQKGMDDALLAVAQGKITIEEMGIVSGKPGALFPLENARVMTPYTLEGTQQKQPAWQMEYEEDKKARKEKITRAQAETAKRLMPGAVQNQHTQGSEEITAQKPNEEPAPSQWVQTPEDISNIQSITIAKAAEMADAMNGKIIPPKQEPKPDITPDVDELYEEDVAQEDQSMVEKSLANTTTEMAMIMAKEWDMKNPPMTPAKPPAGCKSVYKYKQPVINMPNIRITGNMPEDMYFEQIGDWGIITVETGHVMSPQEKENYQTGLKEIGFAMVGNMRLVEQTLTVDKNQVEIKDLDTDMAR